MQVINKYKATQEERAVAKYIGRPSILQNPFPITDTCDRDKSVRLFREYFLQAIADRNDSIIAALEALEEDDLLMCYCKPKACHGDIVKEVWEFFHRSGGVANSLDLFDWVYAKEIKKETAMSEALNKLLSMEYAGYNAMVDEADAPVQYRVHLARMIMTRDPVVENAFRHLVYNPSELDVTSLTPYEDAKLASIKTFIAEFKSLDADYEIALHRFKDNHNHEKIDYDPKDDGVTHINVYSKGKTELGRLLSNFSHTPFKHPTHGFFSSIEAFWYWLSLGMKNDGLRSLHGFQAKKEGAALRDALKKQGDKAPRVPNFKAEIKKAILCKIEQNERLLSLLKNSTLPLTHYYVWGEGENYRVTYPEKYSWIHEYIEDVRKYLNGHAHKVVIAGSRTITDGELIRTILKEQELTIIEFVSGTARGPDTICIDIAEETETPCQRFPADWDTHKKSAGYIRNEEMAKYATFALLFWDGVSHGTQQMIERCKYHDVQHIVIKVPRA